MRMRLADDGEKVTSSERTRGRDGGRQLRAQRERALIVVFHRRRRRRRDCRRSAEETVPNDCSGREPRTEWHTTGRQGARLRAHYFRTSTASAAQNETRWAQPPSPAPFPLICDSSIYEKEVTSGRAQARGKPAHNHTWSALRLNNPE